MATTMNPTLVAFGTFEPTLQIQVVFRKIGRLATHKHPRLKTAHHLGKLLVNGGSACLPRLPQRDELPLTLFPWGLLARPQGTIPLLAGPCRIGPLASRPRVRPPVRGQCTRLDVSTATLHAPFLRLQVALQRLASLL